MGFDLWTADERGRAGAFSLPKGFSAFTMGFCAEGKGEAGAKAKPGQRRSRGKEETRGEGHGLCLGTREAVKGTKARLLLFLRRLNPRE